MYKIERTKEKKRLNYGEKVEDKRYMIKKRRKWVYTEEHQKYKTCTLSMRIDRIETKSYSRTLLHSNKGTMIRMNIYFFKSLHISNVNSWWKT